MDKLKYRKVCTKCSLAKDEEEFYLVKNSRSTRCKACIKEAAKNYYIKLTVNRPKPESKIIRKIPEDIREELKAALLTKTESMFQLAKKYNLRYEYVQRFMKYLRDPKTQRSQNSQ